MSSSNITSENEIAEAVLKILVSTKTGDASLPYLRNRIPAIAKLTPQDLEQSVTRLNEALWEQRLRNIKSHAKNPGNYIADGYLTAPSKGRLRVTGTGRKKVA